MDFAAEMKLGFFGEYSAGPGPPSVAVRSHCAPLLDRGIRQRGCDFRKDTSREV